MGEDPGPRPAWPSPVGMLGSLAGKVRRGVPRPAEGVGEIKPFVPGINARDLFACRRQRQPLRDLTPTEINAVSSKPIENYLAHVRGGSGRAAGPAACFIAGKRADGQRKKIAPRSCEPKSD